MTLPASVLARPASALTIPDAGSFYRLTPFEVASGLVLGRLPIPLDPARSGTPADVVSALEAAVLPALERPPCIVSFSGGRDSSVVLALSARVARRQGLALPIPLTFRFKDEPETDETEFQELVVRHLGISDWCRIQVRSELDFVGPVAQGVLRRHGVIWHPLAFKSVPIFRQARGGTVLTGEGGDEALGQHRVTAVRKLLAPGRLTRANLRYAAQQCAPGPLQRARAQRFVENLTWLRPAARPQVVELMTDHYRAPFHWHRSMLRSMSMRGRVLSLRNRALLAAEHECEEMHPLLDPTFLGALAPLCGRWGYENRNSLLAVLFSDLLPTALLRRTTKATFTGPALSDHTRAFIARWDGTGVDTELVDVDELRRCWSESRIDPRTGALLQQAWLAAQPPPEMALS